MRPACASSLSATSEHDRAELRCTSEDALANRRGLAQRRTGSPTTEISCTVCRGSCSAVTAEAKVRTSSP